MPHLPPDAYPALWLTTNLLTGCSYALIAFVLRRWAGFVRAEYMWLFSAFIGSCGVHHLLHGMAAVWPLWTVLDHWQVLADVVMTSISVVTAVLVAVDAWNTREPSW